MPNLRDLLSSTGNLRYGVPTEEKERLAREGSLPGAPEDFSADQEPSDRYAAGFLFALQYPEVAPRVMRAIDMVKTSDLPFVGGSSPELQSYASQGMREGLRAQEAGFNLESLLRQPAPAESTP